MEELNDLYHELILDHHKHPRCLGTIDNPDAKSSLLNPLCGDEVNLEIKVKDGLVEDIRFTGNGCSISQASASMLGEACRGRSVAEAQDVIKLFTELMRGRHLPETESQLGDAIALEGVQRFPARIRCAMLAWDALEKCLEKLKQNQK